MQSEEDFKPNDTVKKLVYINTSGHPSDTKLVYEYGYIKEIVGFQKALCLFINPFGKTELSIQPFSKLIK